MSNLQNLTSTDCPLENQPRSKELLDLYSDHPNGAIMTDLGFPMNAGNWWAYDMAIPGYNNVVLSDCQPENRSYREEFCNQRTDAVWRSRIRQALA